MRRILPCLLLTFGISIAYAQKDCRNLEYQQQLLATNPGLAATYQKIENFTRTQQLQLMKGTMGADGGNAEGSGAVPAVITIPVVVHVLYNNSSENISDAQIQSQIDEMTQDYRGQNADRSKTPSYFAGLTADAGIQFALAKVDPQGYATTGILRKYTSIQYFSYDDRCKSSSVGGDDAWDSDSYLNIWVCNTTGGLLGYSSLPGGPKAQDGVVINPTVFGTINVGGVFNKGRTAVHEVGHWLNLRHTWGDALCGDDGVDDTPTQQAPHRGCPSGQLFTCGNTAHGDMYMNYMDFTDDACMYMFTLGQGQRMRALFAAGGPRNKLLYSTALTATPLAGTNPASVQAVAVATPSFTVSMYPNPASSFINIKANESVSLAGKTVSIYNRVGQLLYTSVLQSEQQGIDISRWENGIYFVKINGLATKATTKFVKE